MTKAERTRQFIIEQSAPIFNRKGMAGTAVSDLMEATKLAKGGIYGNFESKEEIGAEAFSYLSKGLYARLESLASQDRPAPARMAALVGFYRTGSTPGGCPLLNFGMEADDTNPLIRQRVARQIEATQELFRRVLEEGKQRGEFSESLDPQSFSVKMFALIEGGIMLGCVQQDVSRLHLVLDLLEAELQTYVAS
ncbi:TetR/AcrR family transcriptional regulator [Siphonobacter aquaeclarae]|uniref:Transcriptional regulator, TetR family n=1 Tax=Siphonobacter aquaeclarae TaxID=563176 RepID=A0A1G9KUX1_9BACT|nr:TetR/AcrR family transcriptional regulator [Siphonobacter aquaeclarae]SDL53409.1 transcriptional regulator, TetR family [Siphonobacter aquaeclarae]